MESPFNDFSKAMIPASPAPRGSRVYLHLMVQRLAAKCHGTLAQNRDLAAPSLQAPFLPVKTHKRPSPARPPLHGSQPTGRARRSPDVTC